MTTVSDYYQLEQENKRLKIKAIDYDSLLKITGDLIRRLKICEENSKDWERTANIPEWDGLTKYER